jgi:hypothetical protein
MAIPDTLGAVGISDILANQTYTNSAGESVSQNSVDGYEECDF